MSATEIMFGGIVVAVAAILLGALMEASIGVIATFLLTSAVYFALLTNGRQRSGGGPSA